MITARDRDGKAIFATKDERGNYPEAFCPCCRKRMRARVGDVRRPHWAHESGERCDEWWEEESEWRNVWMATLAGSDKVDIENVLEKDGTRHFYDARFGGKQIAILRRSRLAPEHIAARERFFGDMFWLVEGKASEYARLEEQLVVGMKTAENAPRCYECERSIFSPFFRRWEDCSAPVVFDFASASSSEEEPLWCVLPKGAGPRIVLEFPKADFISRLKETGMLLNGCVAEVASRIHSRFAASRAACNEHRKKSRNEPRVESGSHASHEDFKKVVVFPHVRAQKRMSYIPPPEPVKSYDDYVAEYLSYGYSRQDAEARARIKMGGE